MNIIKRFWRTRNRVEAHPVRVEALVVEDQAEEASLLSGLLRHQGAVVSVAPSIAGAIEALNGPVSFELAFVDLNLPNGSGIEVIRLIKERRRYCHVIVVSGTIEKIPLALGYGYIGVLSKPYTVNSVGEILWLHRLPRRY